MGMKTQAQEKTPAVAHGVEFGLAGNIRQLRKARGWSQSDLAERIGVHLTHVSRVETGKYIPSLDFVVRAAQAFGIAVDALLFKREDNARDVRIEDKNLAERLRLLESLDKDERDALIKVIDSMLTKHRMRELLEQSPARDDG
jgi:transcriptional regulator with XRE-family HTH domain